jgi:hypothetical protein
MRKLGGAMYRHGRSVVLFRKRRRETLGAQIRISCLSLLPIRSLCADIPWDIFCPRRLKIQKTHWNAGSKAMGSPPIIGLLFLS